jgi:hypothetical protein
VRKWVVLAVVFGVVAPARAWPCSFKEDPVPTPQELVAQAEVIVRVRAQPGDDPGSRNARVLVLFDVLDVLKGTLSRPVLGFPGYFEAFDDFNRGGVPYTRVRRGGLYGDCYARNYRANAEYLFFMKSHPSGLPPYHPYALPGQQTPHWAALKPANEQVLGAADPWVAWVTDELARTASR